MSKPTLTKLKNLSVLFTQPWTGNLLANVVKPMVKGEVVVKNRSNIIATLNLQPYTIRVDSMYESYPASLQLSNDEFMQHLKEDMVKSVDQLKDAYDRFKDAGKNLYLKLTGVDDIDIALNMSNSFLQDGINVIAIKKEDGMHYKLPFKGQMIEMTDPEDLFIFLGSLANVFMMTRGQPDPKWFSKNSAADFPF